MNKVFSCKGRWKCEHPPKERVALSDLMMGVHRSLGNYVGPADIYPHTEAFNLYESSAVMILNPFDMRDHWTMDSII